MSEPSVLTQIANSVKRRLDLRRKEFPLEKLIEKATDARQPRDFTKNFDSNVPNIIAEIKFRSPSEGALTKSADKKRACEIAEKYMAGGASALSVLTEKDHFGGDLSYLEAIRLKFDRIPLLMKDFIIDEYQLYEGVSAGADAVLLIVALLEKKKLEDLFRSAGKLGLSILVEVHDETELRLALDLGAKLIGVNNRDLRTLKTSLDTSRRLGSMISAEEKKTVRLVCESGLETASQITELASFGFQGFLIGTSFMKTEDPGETLRKLKAKLYNRAVHE